MQTQNYNDLSTGAGSAGGSPTMRETVDKTADKTAEKIDKAAQSAHDTVDRVHRRAVDLTDRATSEGDRMYQAACSWVSEHPMQAVAGALFVGYLYGRIRG